MPRGVATFGKIIGAVALDYMLYRDHFHVRLDG